MYLLNNTFCLNVMAWVSVGAFMCLSSLRVWAGFCFACVLCAIEFGNRSSPHFVKCARRCFLCIMVTMKTIDDIGTRLESVFEFAEQRHTATMTQKDKSSIEMDMAKKKSPKSTTRIQRLCCKFEWMLALVLASKSFCVPSDPSSRKILGYYLKSWIN